MLNSSRIISRKIAPEPLDAEFCCRICFEIGTDPMISPCKCNGTSKYTHEKCLISWLFVKFPTMENAYCEVCKEKFQLKILSAQKCNFREGMNSRVIYCCCIPILVSVLITIGTILFILGSYHLDFNQNFTFSLAVVIVCSVPIFGTLILLIKSIYRVCIVLEIKELRILEVDK